MRRRARYGSIMAALTVAVTPLFGCSGGRGNSSIALPEEVFTLTNNTSNSEGGPLNLSDAGLLKGGNFGSKDGIYYLACQWNGFWSPGSSSRQLHIELSKMSEIRVGDTLPLRDDSVSVIPGTGTINYNESSDSGSKVWKARSGSVRILGIRHVEKRPGYPAHSILSIAVQNALLHPAPDAGAPGLVNHATGTFTLNGRGTTVADRSGGVIN